MSYINFDLSKRKKTYVCPFCNKHFTQRYVLKTHFIIHTGEKPYPCDVCTKAFNDKSSLRKHRLIHTGEKPHSCDICHKSFVQKITLRKHYSTHTKPYKCSVCSKSFALEVGLKNHLIYHSKQDHVCFVCEKGFPTKRELKKHKRIYKHHKVLYRNRQTRPDVTSGQPLKITILNQKRDAKLSRQHQRNRKNVKERLSAKRFKCNICSVEFTQEIQWRAHFIVHSSNTNFFCDRCGELFSTSKEYDIHIKSHNDVTITFLCEICKASFLTLEELKEHELQHKMPNSITISIHDESIKNISNFTDPCKLEPDDCAIMCEECGDTFYSHSDFLGHLSLHELSNVHDQENPGSSKDIRLCDKCGDIFNDENAFVNHMISHETLCEKCGNIFDSEFFFSEHVLSHFSDDSYDS